MTQSIEHPHPASTADEVPPFDPDSELMADLEGSESAVKAYRREGDALRAAAART